MAWTWNASYQQLFNKAKLLIKVDVCLKFYDDTKLLYLETDASGISLRAALLQLHDNTTCQKGTVPDNIILHPIAFASKSLTGTEQRYWSQDFYCRLAIKAQSCTGQGQSNKRHGHLGGHHTECDGHARMLINGRNTTCIVTG